MSWPVALAGVVLGIILAMTMARAHAAGSPVRISQVSATCSGGSLTGSVTILSSNATASTMTRIHAYAAFQVASAGDWTRSDASTTVDVEVQALERRTTTLPALALSGAPAGAKAARLEVAIDITAPAPTGTVTTTLGVDSGASSPCNLAPTTGGGGTGGGGTGGGTGGGRGTSSGGIGISGLTGTCDSAALTGSFKVANNTADITTVTASLYLAFLDGTKWERGPAGPATFSIPVEGARTSTVPFSVPMTGVPSDVTVTRPEVDLTYLEFAGGQGLSRSASVTGAQVTCTLPTPAAAGSAGRYAVQLGDNLATLAARFGTTQELLAAANGIDARARLKVGQSLVIPAAGAPVATTTTVIGGTRAPGATTTTATTGGSRTTPTPSATATRTTTTPSPTATKTETPAAAAATTKTAVATTTATPKTDTATQEGGDGIMSFLKPVTYGLVIVLLLVGIALGSIVGFRRVREMRMAAAAARPAPVVVRETPAAAAVAPAPPPVPAAAAPAVAPVVAAATTAEDDTPLPADIASAFARHPHEEEETKVTSYDILAEANEIVSNLRRRAA